MYHVKDNDKSNYFIILVINKIYIKYQYIFVVKCLHTLMSMNVMWFGDLRVLYTAFFQGAMIAQSTSLKTFKKARIGWAYIAIRRFS